MNDAIGREDARARQWSAANASIEGSESVVRRSVIKTSRKARQVQDTQDRSWTRRCGCGSVNVCAVGELCPGNSPSWPEHGGARDTTQ